MATTPLRCDPRDVVGLLRLQVTGHPLLGWSSLCFEGTSCPGHCEFWRLHGEHTGPLRVLVSASVQSSLVSGNFGEGASQSILWDSGGGSDAVSVKGQGQCRPSG